MKKLKFDQTGQTSIPASLGVSENVVDELMKAMSVAVCALDTCTDVQTSGDVIEIAINARPISNIQESFLLGYILGQKIAGMRYRNVPYGEVKLSHQ